MIRTPLRVAVVESTVVIIDQGIVMTKELLAKLKSAAREIFAGRAEVVAAYLYDSSPVTKDYEDIDIGFLLDRRFRPPAMYEVVMAREFEKRLPEEFDVRILNGRPVRFLFQVIKNGELLFCSNEDERVILDVRVMKEYFDMRPYFELYDRMRRERYVARDH